MPCTRSQTKRARLLENEHEALGNLRYLSGDGFLAVCPFLTANDLTHLAMTCRSLRSKVNDYRPSFCVSREERLPTKMAFDSWGENAVSELQVECVDGFLASLVPDLTLVFFL